MKKNKKYHVTGLYSTNAKNSLVDNDKFSITFGNINAALPSSNIKTNNEKDTLQITCI